ncbi:hypothetical protein MMC34_006076 [Xylographa carneopallida]|nr:hypothetical protein [Xylographa carneopallida]
MVDSNAATKTLQEAMLANSIVSFQGVRGKALATDLALELHNNDLKRERKNRSSSSQDQDTVLAQCALNGPYLGVWRRAVLLWLGTPSDGYHPPKGAHKDIFIMAQDLDYRGLRSRNDRFFQDGSKARDLFADGVKALGEAVSMYNMEACKNSFYEERDIENTLQESDALQPGSPPESPVLAADEYYLNGLDDLF